ncbi:VOC family protein [Cellulomonas oligotrophica]|nr:glyoxalase [Cellulomonas oligotrophica]
MSPPGSEDLSRAFYRDVLGLDEIPKPAALAVRGGCWFRGAGIELHLSIEEDFHPARRAHPGLLVTDLSGHARRLGAAGHAVEWDDGLPGMRRLHCHDPHGNRIELLEPSISD